MSAELDSARAWVRRGLVPPSHVCSHTPGRTVLQPESALLLSARECHHTREVGLSRRTTVESLRILEERTSLDPLIGRSVPMPEEPETSKRQSVLLVQQVLESHHGQTEGGSHRR